MSAGALVLLVMFFAIKAFLRIAGRKIFQMMASFPQLVFATEAFLKLPVLLLRVASFLGTVAVGILDMMFAMVVFLTLPELFMILESFQWVAFELEAAL